MTVTFIGAQRAPWRPVQRLNARVYSLVWGRSVTGASIGGHAPQMRGNGRRRDNCVMNEPLSAPVALSGEPDSPLPSASVQPALAAAVDDGPSLKFSSVGLSSILQRAVADQGYT